MKHATISFNICTIIFYYTFSHTIPTMRHLWWNSNLPSYYFDNWDCCDTCCYKVSLLYNTYTCLSDTVSCLCCSNIGRPFSARSCRLESLTKFDGTFCVDTKSFKSRCGQRSNWFLEYFVLRISVFTTILYISCLLWSTITPKIFVGSPLPQSTMEMGTATLSPALPVFKSIWEHLTILSACDNWDSCALFC